MLLILLSTLLGALLSTLMSADGDGGARFFNIVGTLGAVALWVLFYRVAKKLDGRLWGRGVRKKGKRQQQAGKAEAD